jgi:hypothetical protein
MFLGKKNSMNRAETSSFAHPLEGPINVVLSPHLCVFLSHSTPRSGQLKFCLCNIPKQSKSNRLFKNSRKNVAVIYELISETLRYTVHRFRECGRVQWKPRCGRLKENIATSNGKRTPIIPLLALRQQNEISVSTCQRIVRKDLEDSLTAEQHS